jgi:lysophospholipase L1-like esterase
MTAFVNLNPKRWVATGLLLVVSIAVSALLAEGILRLVFEPVDYLAPYLVRDKVVRHRVEANSAGHDSWGFRNRSVPKQSEIVAIGDSMTYGIAATAANSWPATLQRLSGKSVYNLGLGGYGPVEYLYLLENNAVQLNPSTIIVGFYFGNDLMDAFYLTYRRPHWKHLRSPGFADEPDEPIRDNDQGVSLGNFRSFLSHNSILYRSAMLSFGEILRFVELKYVSKPEAGITIFERPQFGVRTGFTPVEVLNNLDANDPRTTEGLRITLKMFREMNQFCAAKGIAFHVVLIPTKERAFSQYIDRDDVHLSHQAEIHKLIKNEREFSTLIKQSFDENQISYIDVTEVLEGAVSKNIYPSNQDGHPNKDGYEIIAKEVMAKLSRN